MGGGAREVKIFKKGNGRRRLGKMEIQNEQPARKPS
jgi:hypothetical protein